MIKPMEQAAENENAARERRKKVPRKVTRKHLENVALWYLARFQASARSLEKVLMRRVARSARHHGTDPEEGAALVADLLTRYRETGLLDDAAYAEARAETLHRRGMALRLIALKLREKGVGKTDIDQALERLRARLAADSETGEDLDPDLVAARRYAQRRRLGPWRKRPVAGDEDDEAREKQESRDLAALARAGFSFDTARDALRPESEN